MQFNYEERGIIMNNIEAEETSMFESNEEAKLTEYEFLEKLFAGLRHAKTLDGMVLKGGFRLIQTLENSRVTQDIDFSIDKEKGWENLQAAIRASVDSLGSEMCEIVSTRDPQETMSAKIEILIKSLDSVVGIDASWEPIEVGTVKLNIMGIDIDAYTLCHVLADKYCVIFSKKRFRRTKDLYDIYNILSNFSIDYAEFDDVVRHNRNQIDWERTPIRDDVIKEYEKAWNKLTISVIEDDLQKTLATKPDFKKVFETVCAFILEYLSMKGGTIKGYWDRNNVKGVEK